MYYTARSRAGQKMFGGLFGLGEEETTETLHQYGDDGLGFTYWSDEDDSNKADAETPPVTAESYCHLEQVVPILASPASLEGLQVGTKHTDIIARYMGTMAQCRIHCAQLRNAGVVGVLVKLLELQLNANHLKPSSGSTINQEQITYEIEVVTGASGALRDMSCAHADIRREVREHGGLQLLFQHLYKYHGISWDTLSESQNGDLKLFTNVCGAIRNVTHSTRANCVILHELGLTEELIWRLMHGSDNMFDLQTPEKQHTRTELYPPKYDDITLTTKLSFPDLSKPWRDASYRAVGSIINIAEKCDECAIMCASNPVLIELLVDCWGGKNKRQNKVFLHLGLAAILTKANQILKGGLPDKLNDILVKEERRRKAAQEHEKIRLRTKQQQQQATNKSNTISLNINKQNTT